MIESERLVLSGCCLVFLFVAAGCSGTGVTDISATSNEISQKGIDAGPQDAAPPPVVPPPPISITTPPVGGFPPTDDCAIDSDIVCNHGHQGRSLLGFDFPTPFFLTLFTPSQAHWRTGFDRPPIESVAIDHLGLDVRAGGRRLEPQELEGLEFTGNIPLGDGRTADRTLAITEAPVVDAAGHFGYSIEQSVDGVTWARICGEFPSSYALVIPGYIQGRMYTYSTLGGMFVCSNSAAGKAIAFGYSPLDDNDMPRSDKFFAATIMARADYCGVNESNTVDGTNIMYYDLNHLAGSGIPDVHTRPNPRDALPYFFEGAWTSFGRAGGHAICLSKLRWQAMPPSGFCNSTLPDPRIRGTGGQFCEDLGGLSVSTTFGDFLRSLGAQGGLVFSSSQFNDVGLWTWLGSAPDGSRPTITTTRGFWAGEGGPSIPPPQTPGYISAASLYAATISTTNVSGTMPLRLYYNPVTTTYRSSVTPPSAWCNGAPCAANSWMAIRGTDGLVGYVYQYAFLVPDGMRAIPLRAWTTIDPALGDIEHSKYIILPEGQAGFGPFTYELPAVEGYGIGKN